MYGDVWGAYERKFWFFAQANRGGPAVNSVWPTHPSEQFGRLADVFGAAARQLLTIDHRVRLAGNTLLLRVAGADLAAAVTRPLVGAVGAEEHGGPALSVDLWDSTAASGEFVSNAPAEHRTYGLVSSDSGGRFIVDSRPNGLLILDRLANRIVGHYAGASSLFLDERARPFHRLLSIWLGDRGAQFIHAGVVSASDNAGILLAGGGGAGKSTTSLLCLLAGFGYLSDDFAAFTQQSNKITAHCLFTSAVVQMRHLKKFPSLVAAAHKPNHVHEDKSIVFVNELMPSCIRSSALIRAILLPQVMKQPETRIKAATAREALLKLAPSSVMLLPGGGPRALQRLASLVNTVPAFRLELGQDFDRIPDLIFQHASEISAQMAAG